MSIEIVDTEDAMGTPRRPEYPTMTIGELGEALRAFGKQDALYHHAGIVRNRLLVWMDQQHDLPRLAPNEQLLLNTFTAQHPNWQDPDWSYTTQSPQAEDDAAIPEGAILEFKSAA